MRFHSSEAVVLDVTELQKVLQESLFAFLTSQLTFASALLYATRLLGEGCCISFLLAALFASTAVEHPSVHQDLLQCGLIHSLVDGKQWLLA
jgi:hypothetical protein